MKTKTHPRYVHAQDSRPGRSNSYKLYILYSLWEVITRHGFKCLQTPARKAEKLKEKGNALFKEGNYDAAVKYYTEAISVCPDEETIQKSTYYQNRAAAYERLVNYSFNQFQVTVCP